MEATIEHRWGGHRGRATEWEITSSDGWVFENFAKLPENPAVWILSSKYVVTFTLDQGNPESVAMEIVSAIINEDFPRLLAAHQKVVPYVAPAQDGSSG